ncbi:Early nodulin-like protein 1, partial [Bienertia sinuspersici]
MFVLYTLLILIVLQAKVFCYQHKVGDLNSWNIPPSSNSDVYAKWSKNNVFRVKDSLLFLYPPSQDSVIQVTPQAYKSCNIKDPILENTTSLVEKKGIVKRGKSFQISIDGDGAIVYAPSEGPGAMSETADSPSYQQAFGSIPTNQLHLQSTDFNVLTSFVGLGIW